MRSHLEVHTSDHDQLRGADDGRLDSEVLRPLFIGSEEVETPPPQPTATVGGEDGGVQLERIPSLVRGDSALEPLDPSRVPPPAMPQ